MIRPISGRWRNVRIITLDRYNNTFSRCSRIGAGGGQTQTLELLFWKSKRQLSTTATTSSWGDAAAAAVAAASGKLPPSILEDYKIIEEIPLEDVRNFGFIAHIDHGKSSLSSRVLELTGNLGRESQQLALEMASGMTTSAAAAASGPAKKQQQQIQKASNRERIELLDTLLVEQQRGITVKASTASMLYPHPSAIGPRKTLLLNMYDTPGHVDFGLEVTRSLCFIEGAVLLLDATQGIQAQTWSVYEKVKAMAPNDPKLLIALTKVDLESARPIHCALTISEWLNWDDPDSIINTSARSRIGIKTLLDSVCQLVPSPKRLQDDDGTNTILRAQVVDSWYDERGVNCLVRIVSGRLAEGDRIALVTSTAGGRAGGGGGEGESSSNATTTTIGGGGDGGGGSSSQQTYSVQEVGLVLPHSMRTGSLSCGQMGYVRFGLRDPRQAMPGTMLLYPKHTSLSSLILPRLPVTAVRKSVLYASVHPEAADGFEDLCNAVDRLALNDTGLEVQKTSSSPQGSEGGGPFLGPGLRVGFQGLLHVEVFRQRLSDEHGIQAVVTPPKVPYRITFFPNNKNNLKEPTTKIVEDLSQWPEAGTKYLIEEPMVQVRIVAPMEDAGAVMDLMTRKRGRDLATNPIDEEKWIFTAKLPWGEVVVDFHDQLKNVTSGFGSMDTFEAGHAEANLSKVDICLNGDVVDPLAFVCHKDAAYGEANIVCRKLKEVLPRQQFVTVIQAKVGSKVIAAERISAYRKDVLTKSGKTVGGGDETRKKKLLEKQKEGKKRMQTTGKIKLSQAAFNSVISRNT